MWRGWRRRRSRGSSSLWRGFLVDDLPDMIKLPSHFGFCPLETGLAQIDGIRQQGTAGMNAARVLTFFQFNAFPFQELAQVLVKFIFSYRFHSMPHLAALVRFPEGCMGHNYTG